MHHAETLEPRQLLSASTVAISTETAYQLSHGALVIRASGNLYGKVVGPSAGGGFEVQVADDMGGSADLNGVTNVVILGTEKSGQTIDWQTQGLTAAIFAAGKNDSVFVTGVTSDTTDVLLTGSGDSLNFNGVGSANAFATGNSKTDADSLTVNGQFNVLESGFETVTNNGTGSVTSPRTWFGRGIDACSLMSHCNGAWR